jgi:hypothetical protein
MHLLLSGAVVTTDAPPCSFIRREELPRSVRGDPSGALRSKWTTRSRLNSPGMASLL